MFTLVQKRTKTRTTTVLYRENVRRGTLGHTPIVCVQPCQGRTLHLSEYEPKESSPSNQLRMYKSVKGVSYQRLGPTDQVGPEGRCRPVKGSWSRPHDELSVETGREGRQFQGKIHRNYR